MADFSINIPDEYLDGGEDFGFTTVDTDKFEQAEIAEREITADVADELASGLVSELNAKLTGLEGKINAILIRLDDSTDSEMVDDSHSERIEEKIDKILAMENTEMVTALNQQGENIRPIIDEVEDRKNQLNDQYREKLSEVEKTVLPLLINLTKNPEREYLKWPDRVTKVKSYIQRVLKLTRGENTT